MTESACPNKTPSVQEVFNNLEKNSRKLWESFKDENDYRNYLISSGKDKKYGDFTEYVIQETFKLKRKNNKT